MWRRRGAKLFFFFEGCGAKLVPRARARLGELRIEHDGLLRLDLLKIYWAFLWAGISRV